MNKLALTAYLVCFTFFISNAQFSWGLHAGTNYSKAIIEFEDGFEDSGRHSYRPSLGYQAGLDFGFRFSKIRVGMGLSFAEMNYKPKTPFAQSQSTYIIDQPIFIEYLPFEKGPLFHFNLRPSIIEQDIKFASDFGDPAIGLGIGASVKQTLMKGFYLELGSKFYGLQNGCFDDPPSWYYPAVFFNMGYTFE